MPGADAAADVGPGAGAARELRRNAQEFRSALVPGRGAHRGDGGQGLSRHDGEGLEAAAQVEGVEIFHAGTKAEGGRIVANGGRVLNVSALGKTVAQAQARAYRAIDRITWADGFCRRDIGFRAVARERNV